MTARTLRRYAVPMKILARDAEVLRWISRFSMLASKQIEGLVFRTSRSSTTFKNSIRRLHEDGLVVRVNRRVPGGSQGGSGQYAYRLSPTAWRMYRSTPYKNRRTIDYHALEVAAAYIRCLDAQDEGWARVHYVEIEDEAWRTIAGDHIRPDLYLEFDNLEANRRRYMAVEVDRGTENRPDIRDKVRRYESAREAGGETFRVFPQILFLAPDVARVEQLRRWIREAYRGDEALFVVGLLDEFPALLR